MLAVVKSLREESGKDRAAWASLRIVFAEIVEDLDINFVIDHGIFRIGKLLLERRSELEHPRTYEFINRSQSAIQSQQPVDVLGSKLFAVDIGRCFDEICHPLVDARRVLLQYGEFVLEFADVEDELMTERHLNPEQIDSFAGIIDIDYCDFRPNHPLRAEPHCYLFHDLYDHA